MNKGLLRKSDVLKIVDEFLELAKDHNIENSIRTIREVLEEYKKGSFDLVIIGEVKKGKSSFINALLREPALLPVDTEVATSTVYKVMYGDTKKYEVFFNSEINETDGSEVVPPPLEITEAELEAYGTENGNPGNEKEVEFISIQLPNSLLESGVTIIDTPGLGGLFAGHSDVIWRIAPNADAVCLVLDSVSAVASKQEIEGLQKFLEVSERLDAASSSLFFVQTKIDAPDESDAQAYHERNLDILSESLSVPKAELNYFPISSQLKADADAEGDPDYLKDSGFPQLLDFFNGELRKEKEEYLARQLLQPISFVTQQLLFPAIMDEQQTYEVLKQVTQEELIELDKENAEIQKGLQEWAQKTYPQVVQDFNDKITDLQLDIDQQLVNALDYGPNSPIVASIIESLREQNLSAEQLRSRGYKVAAECVEKCRQLVSSIFESYQEKFTAATTEMLKTFNISLINALTSSIDTSSIHSEVKEISIARPSGFTTVRNLGYGAIFGGFLVQPIQLVIPAIGIPLYVSSMVIAAFLAWRDFEKQAKESTLSAIQTQLLDTVRITGVKARQEFSRCVLENKKSARDLLAEIAANMNAEVASKQANISAMKSTSQREKADTWRRSDALKSKAADVQKLLDNVKGMLNPSEA